MSTEQLRKNDFITVESESDPGVLKKYLVMDVSDSGYVKLAYQDDVCVRLGRQHLVDYMSKNNFGPKILATILGVSRTTVYRYISGERSIPQDVFDQLGIQPPMTYLQSAATMSSVHEGLLALRDQVIKILSVLGGVAL